MADITLICRLHKKPGRHSIRVNTGDTVDSLIGEIKQAFDCNEVRDIVLWKTEMPNEPENTFTNLILAEGDNLTKLTAGELNRFWGEGRPLEDHTHIIIDSPALVFKQEIDRLREESELYLDENASDYIITDSSRSGWSYLKELFHAKIIRVNDVLRIKKGYKNINVHIQCKVTNFDDGILSVMLIDRNEEQEKGFFSLAQLEKWLLEHSLDAEDRPESYENSGNHIEIIRNERLLGSVRTRRNCYIYNQKNRKDSVKSESKQDADLSETLSRLSITEENPKSTASEVGSRELSPILDKNLYGKLRAIKVKFWKEYKKSSSLSYVGVILADGEPVIHAVVNRNRSGPSVNLPNKFEEYSVIFSYGSVEPDHCDYHKELKPGISIGRSADPPNACTLGVFFQEEGSGNVFLLTTKHGTGEEGSIVFQPGKLDNKTPSKICAKVTYSFLGTDDSGHLLDYSFCEIDECRTIPTIPNVPLSTDIAIKSCKLYVKNNNSCDFVRVHKVGRSTFHTVGWVSDNYDSFTTEILSQEEVSAIAVISTGGSIFAKKGDSGSAIFDDEGILWGIHHGSNYPYHFIIPVNLILDDVNNRFGVKFNLM